MIFVNQFAILPLIPKTMLQKVIKLCQVDINSRQKMG